MEVTKHGVKELERIGEGELRTTRGETGTEVSVEEGIIGEGISRGQEWISECIAPGIWLVCWRRPDVVFVIQLHRRLRLASRVKGVKYYAVHTLRLSALFRTS